MLKKINAEIYRKVQLLLESYINYTEETKISTYTEKGEKNKHTKSSTFLTVRILHIPIMLHKLLAFNKRPYMRY